MFMKISRSIREFFVELNYCDEIPFKSDKNVSLDQSSVYSRYDQISDGFRIAHSIPTCEYFHMNKFGKP